MPKNTQTPASALKTCMAQFELTPYALSRAICLSNSAVLQILKGKTKISVPTALRLSKFFGQPPVFWLNLQRDEDLLEAEKDKDLTLILKGISKVHKPIEKPKAKAPAKKLPKKNTLADKRKSAAKAPGARPAKRKAKS